MVVAFLIRKGEAAASPNLTTLIIFNEEYGAKVKIIPISWKE
jgi:hypothetical protein